MIKKQDKNDILTMNDRDTELIERIIGFGEISDKKEALEILIARLKYYIKSKYAEGISLKQLGEESDVNDSYLNKIIKGTIKDGSLYRPVPSIDILNRLSYTLEITPMKLVQGLERIIKSPDINIDDSNVNNNEAQMEYIKSLGNKFDIFNKGKEKSQSKIKLIPVENIIQIDDNSMNSFNIVKGSSLLYTRSYNEFTNGHIYVLKYFNKIIVRRVWKIKNSNTYLLIPCSNSIEYQIIEVNKDKEYMEIIGVPINITISM